jgi:hypothetical protein
MERDSVSRSHRTVKTKGMNSMPGSLRDKHQLIPDPRKCGLFFRDGFGRNAGSSFFPSSPRIGSFTRGINERRQKTKSVDIEIVSL